MEARRPYVPIVRWRPAEIRAIKQLNGICKASIKPVFEFILPPPTTDRKDYKKVLEDSKTKFLRKLPKIAKQMLDCWGIESAFIDVHLLDGDIRPTAFDSILSSTRNLGISTIPVTYIVPVESSRADIDVRRLAVNFANRSEQGLCIRIDISHFGPQLSQAIEKFVKDEALDITKTDLLVDLKVIDSQPAGEEVASQISQLPYLVEWRSIILAAGSFPRDLSNFEKHGHYTIPRHEWHTWYHMIKQTGLERQPLYSDYTIQHPIHYGHIPGANPSASIRYTQHETWELFRGEGLRNEKGAGFKQYSGLANLLMTSSFFKGMDYSFGDAYIYEKATSRDDHTGTPQTWLTAGINHHITLVVDQIANLA